MMFLLGFLSPLNLAFGVANLCIEGNIKGPIYFIYEFLVC